MEEDDDDDDDDECELKRGKPCNFTAAAFSWYMLYSTKTVSEISL